MLFLYVHSNFCVAIYVYGVNSRITLLTPFPALPDPHVQERGDVAANAGGSLPANRTVCRTDL